MLKSALMRTSCPIMSMRKTILRVCYVLSSPRFIRSLSQLVQSLSQVQLFVTPWAAARQASLSITNSWSLLKLMSIQSVIPSNHLILCHTLLLLPSSFPATGPFPMSWFFTSVLEFQPQHQSFQWVFKTDFL